MPYPKSRLGRPVRLGIMISLIIIFFVISPLIILYTTGYRYDFTTREIKKTGVISIDAKPEDVKVFLNDLKINKSMPIRLTNRAPGTYRLRIEETGYKTWEKDITVESTLTTYIRNLTLFKESLPIELLENLNGNIIKVHPSYDGKYILLIIQENGFYEIDLLNTDNNQKVTMIRKKIKNLPEISWSPYDNFVFIKIEDDLQAEIQLFNAGNTDITETYTYPVGKIVHQWQKNTLVPGIFLLRNSLLYRINTDYENKIDNTTTTKVWFVDEKNNIWQYTEKTGLYVKKDNSEYYFALEEKIEKIIDVNENRAILQTENNFLVIKFHNNELEEKIIIPTQSLFYNHDTKEWISWSDFELWSIYENGTTELLNRTSDKIKFIRPLDKYGVLAIATENSILGFNPGYYVTHELFSGGLIEEIVANKKTRNIYFLGSVGQKNGLFQLEY